LSKSGYASEDESTEDNDIDQPDWMDVIKPITDFVIFWNEWLHLYKGNEESSNDASTAEISRLTVPINSFVQMVFPVTSGIFINTVDYVIK
jgi:hypothetical protein